MSYRKSKEAGLPEESMGSNPIPCATTQIPCVPEFYTDFLTEARALSSELSKKFHEAIQNHGWDLELTLMKVARIGTL